MDSDPVLVKTLDAQCPVSSNIELKQGAQVSIAQARGGSLVGNGILLFLWGERFLCYLLLTLAPQSCILHLSHGVSQKGSPTLGYWSPLDAEYDSIKCYRQMLAGSYRSRQAE